jgi:glyoxylase-like metal-dependent hydrolase (beta-lactamase superfamily II)
MLKEIRTIRLPLPFRMGEVNCYLIETGDGYVLIDTGSSNSRQELVEELEMAGCKPGFLNLILLTHGDFDHIGNAAYLRETYGGKIAMHPDDAGMAERGDMFVNRKQPNLLIRRLLPLFTGFGRAERFSPDFLVEDGDDLSEYGIEARVVSIPGHSKGSIGILAAGGDPSTGSGQAPSTGSGRVLFCGDLMESTKTPVLNSLTDDLTAANASIQKLGSMNIGTVYPGHGWPFPMHLFLGGNPSAG